MSGNLETVRIRDKSAEGGSRIINKVDLTENDLVYEDKPTKKSGKDVVESDTPEGE
jgi:hypothetical protein